MKIKYFRIMCSLIIAGSTLNAFAIDRPVNLSIPSSQTNIKLTNPSTTTVTYSLQCYNQDGISTVSLSNQTLDSNKSTTISVVAVDSGKCAGNANPDSSTTANNCSTVYLCPGSTNYAGASTLCGPGQKLADLSVGFYSCTGTSSYWLKQPTSFETSSDGGCTYSAAPANNYPYLDMVGCTYSNYCRLSAGSSGINRCLADSNAANTRGAACIAYTEVAGHCKVTLVNPTSSQSLSSPSFKGGAAF